MKIISDTSTLYSPVEGSKLDIEILPLSVSLGKDSYREYEDIETSVFLEEVKSGKLPTSSQPALGATIEAFEKYKDQDILVISMAQGLSGTYDGMLSARASVANHKRIHVINSRTLCGPHRYLVQKACDLKEKGKSLEEIKKTLTALMDTETSFLIPKDFGFLKRGGRLTPLAATIGGLLKIVPVMIKSEDGKRLEKFATKRTLRGAIQDISNYFVNNNLNEDYVIYISHAGVLEEAKKIQEQLAEVFEKVQIKLYELSPAFITQGGPGCIAIQAMKK